MVFGRDFYSAMHMSSESLRDLTSAWMGIPFDLARQQYISAVQAGVIPRSMLHSARFSRALNAAEQLLLGPLARRY